MPNITRSPDGTITINLVIPWPQIQKEYSHQIDLAVESAEIPGFRKGKAPRNLVEPKLDSNSLYSKSIEVLLPQIYSQTVKELELKPVVYPQIKIIEGKDGADWQFEAVTCETPSVTLSDYQTQAKQLKTDKPEDRLSAVLKMLLDTSKVILPQILIDSETNHRLANLTDNLTKLGMSIDHYLSAKKTTVDSLKAAYMAESSADLSMEFILQQIGRDQNITDRTKVLDFLKTL